VTLGQHRRGVLGRPVVAGDVDRLVRLGVGVDRHAEVPHRLQGGEADRIGAELDLVDGVSRPQCRPIQKTQTSAVVTVIPDGSKHPVRPRSHAVST